MIISRIYRVFNVNVLHHIQGGGDFMTGLHTIDADTLQPISYEPISFFVEELMPPGLHLLAGSPDVGESWLLLQP